MPRGTNKSAHKSYVFQGIKISSKKFINLRPNEHSCKITEIKLVVSEKTLKDFIICHTGNISPTPQKKKPFFKRLTFLEKNLIKLTQGAFMTNLVNPFPNDEF